MSEKECTGEEACECDRCMYERDAYEKDERLMQLVQRSTPSLADLYRTARAKGLVLKKSDYA